jgi:hypothetical protein
MKDFTEGEILFTCVICLVLFFACIIGGVEQINFTGEQAAIEQLRSDLSKVDPTSPAASSILGKVAEKNQEIATYHINNKRFFISWFVPDSWDSVRLIEIPTAKK